MRLQVMSSRLIERYHRFDCDAEWTKFTTDFPLIFAMGFPNCRTAATRRNCSSQYPVFCVIVSNLSFVHETSNAISLADGFFFVDVTVSDTDCEIAGRDVISRLISVGDQSSFFDVVRMTFHTLRDMLVGQRPRAKWCNL